MVTTALGDGYGLVQVLGCIEHLDVCTVGSIQKVGEGILELRKAADLLCQGGGRRRHYSAAGFSLHPLSFSEAIGSVVSQVRR